jgi:hypothetical protein
MLTDMVKLRGAFLQCFFVNTLKNDFNKNSYNCLYIKFPILNDIYDSFTFEIATAAMSVFLTVWD